MIKKENTRICITIPKVLYKDIKKISKQENKTYSKIITEWISWYLTNTSYRDLKFNPNENPNTIKTINDLRREMLKYEK